MHTFAGGVVLGTPGMQTVWVTDTADGSILGGFQVAVENYVTNTLDSGAGSLRQALLYATANPGVDTIGFDIGAGLQSIQPLSPLPAITDPVILDATMQPGYAGTPLIELNGAGRVSTGLRVVAGNSTIRGFVISDFGDRGIEIVGPNADGNVVAGNFIGTTADGNAARGNYQGIFLSDGASDNVIGGSTPGDGNVISGNTSEGMTLHGAGTGNIILGNLIGLGRDGTTPLGNSGHGISITASGDTRIGGDTSAARNVISANGGSGLFLLSGTTTVTGNYIGTDANGILARGNALSGAFSGPNSWLVLGGLTATPGTGLGNTVAGNYIGLDKTGQVALSNQQGVSINAASNTVGGSVAGARNVISGNTINGIVLTGAGATGNVVQANYIGTDKDGAFAVGNASNGVVINTGAWNNTIGGKTDAERNIISGNANNGVVISGADTSGNVVAGNYIGTDKEGDVAIANRGAWGLEVRFGAQNTRIQGNVISGNAANGINIQTPEWNGTLPPNGVTTSGTVVGGNFIGTKANGLEALGNGGIGIYVVQGAINSTIGGATDADRNIISGNLSEGILIAGATTTGTLIAGNYIGTNKYGDAALANAQGIAVRFGAQDTRVERNLISGNNGDGILIQTPEWNGALPPGGCRPAGPSSPVTLSAQRPMAWTRWVIAARASLWRKALPAPRLAARPRPTAMSSAATSETASASSTPAPPGTSSPATTSVRMPPATPLWPTAHGASRSVTRRTIGWAARRQARAT